MKVIKLILITSLYSILSLCIGCSHYNRVLTLKDQLNNSEKYIELISGKQFTLIFKKPVLLNGDIYKLSRINPYLKMKNENISNWTYHFDKINMEKGETIGNIRVSGKAQFINNVLQKVHLPWQLSSAISKTLLWEIICYIPNGSISILKRTFIISFPVTKIPCNETLPSKAKVIKLSGIPTKEFDKNHIHYRHKPLEKNENLRTVTTHIDYWFNKHNHLLRKASLSINGYRGVIQFIDPDRK
ncbi:hypothetical protein KAJ27_04345 [bacterium]|nr:hypothetical protein [bacterium]